MKNILIISTDDNSVKNYLTNDCQIVFDKVIEIDSKTNPTIILNTIKKYNEAYFVNFNDIYRKILPLIPFSIVCKSIFTYELSDFTNPIISFKYNNVIEFYDRSIYKEIYTFSSDLYVTLKKAKYNVSVIKHNIDYKVNKPNNKNKEVIIGVLNDDRNPNNNFYNVLTALTMVKVDKIKLISNMPATKEFIERFNLPVIYCSNINDVVNNSTLNIYTNFTSNKVNLLKESLDRKIPCIIGNIDEEIRKKYNQLLILKSDDNVNELRDIIINILKKMKWGRSK